MDAVLLDIDGVLAVSWRALPGAAETLSWLRHEAIPFKLITNTTTHTRDDLAHTLGEAGLEVASGEIVTAVTATASYLRVHHPEAPVFVLSDGDAGSDLTGAPTTDVEAAEVIVLGGACEDFTYAMLNRVFRRLMEGAALVGMHRNLYWKTSDGWELDGGAYIAGLEEAAGVTATICGKPTRAFFEAALHELGAPAEGAVMVGDDIVNDVLGAQEIGITGVLVKTGKFMPQDLEKGVADHVIASIAELPSLLRATP